MKRNRRTIKRPRTVLHLAAELGVNHGKRLERAAILRLIDKLIRYYKLNPNAQESFREIATLIRARGKTPKRRPQ